MSYRFGTPRQHLDVVNELGTSVTDLLLQIQRSDQHHQNVAAPHAWRRKRYPARQRATTFRTAKRMTQPRPDGTPGRRPHVRLRDAGDQELRALWYIAVVIAKPEALRELGVSELPRQHLRKFIARVEDGDTLGSGVR